MTQNPDQKYKIQVLVNGTQLTFQPCTILHEEDPVFIKFLDKFGKEFRYNKTFVIMEEKL